MSFLTSRWRASVAFHSAGIFHPFRAAGTGVERVAGRPVILSESLCQTEPKVQDLSCYLLYGPCTVSCSGVVPTRHKLIAPLSVDLQQLLSVLFHSQHDKDSSTLSFWFFWPAIQQMFFLVAIPPSHSCRGSFKPSPFSGCARTSGPFCYSFLSLRTGEALENTDAEAEPAKVS